MEVREIREGPCPQDPCVHAGKNKAVDISVISLPFLQASLGDWWRPHDGNCVQDNPGPLDSPCVLLMDGMGG